MFIHTFGHRALARLGVLVLGLTAAMATPAHAQDRWQPFVGCWRPVEQASSESSSSATLCVVPATGRDGVEMVTIGPGAAESRKAVISDGAQHELSTGTCTGWEQADWASSGHVVYLRSQFSCENGIARMTTGVLSIVSPSQWVEVQTVSAGNAKDVRVVRYESAWDMTGIPADVARALEGQQVASGTARIAASGALSLAEVSDASRHLDGSTVEAWLVEVGARSDFHVDAKALAQLSKAGVSTSVIDLLVAMSYPDVFRIDHSGGTIAAVAQERVARTPTQPTLDDFAGMSRGGYSSEYYSGYDPYYDPFFTGYYSSAAAYRLYGSRAYGPNGNRYYMDYSPTIVVVRSGSGGGDGVTVLPQAAEKPKSRVVNGRGYSQSPGSSSGSGNTGGASKNVNTSSSSGSSSSDNSSSGSSTTSGSDSGSAALPSGYSSGDASESTGRTAKPRGSN